MSRKTKNCSAGNTDTQKKTAVPETLVFLGDERAYSDVLDYYEMIRDAYHHYVSHECRRMTESKRLYVTSFKQRVDNLALTLGVSERMPLPKNIDIIVKKNEKEE